MISFEMMTFAAKRNERMTSFEDEIRAIVVEALANYGAPGWYDDIVIAAGVLWSEIFSSESPTGQPDDALLTYLRELRESLDKTGEPDDPPSDGQVDRVVRWVAVYTVNSATYFAGRDREGMQKVWLTMDDDKVRSIHRAVDNVSVGILDSFEVGGVRMQFPGEPVGSPEHWINCRCILAITGGIEMGTKGMTFAVQSGEDTETDELTDEQLVDEDLVDDVTELPWHGVLTVEGVDTGDKRRIAKDSLEFPEAAHMPAPLMYQEYTDGVPHGSSVRVGRIDRMERQPNGEIRAWGAFNLNIREANTAIDGIVFGGAAGVSVDLDSVEFELEFPEGTEFDNDSDTPLMLPQPTEVVTKGRLRGATMVGFGAFIEGYIALGEDFDMETADPGEQDALVASASWQDAAWDYFAPGTHDGPGWLTHPKSTQRLRNYWVHGEGAAKIRWGVSGDFNRCRRQLAKYVNPAFLAGTCANLHKEALKVWPGRERGDKASLPLPSWSILASAHEYDGLPRAWFEDPGFDNVTPPTIDGRRYYGHLAQWGTCHVGSASAGRCVMPPSSPSDYSYYRIGLVDTDDGPVRTGTIVMGTGHADPRIAAAKATEHYDNTGYAVADVAVGEDGFGIWFSGVLRDDVDAADVKVLKASAVSGDWRDVRYVGSPDEMVGLVAVNAPGFPMPRYAMDGERQVSLLASAGMVLPEKENTMAVNENPTWSMPGQITFTATTGTNTSAYGFAPTPVRSAEELEAIGRVVADELEYRAERKAKLSSAKDETLIQEAAARRAERIAKAKNGA